MILALALALFAQTPDERRSIVILDPPWLDGEISVNARLLVIAEIVSAEPHRNLWLELRGQGRDWERRTIPPSKQLRVSPLKVVTVVAIEPRAIPWLQAGDEFEARLRCRDRDGENLSESLVARVADADRREAGLLDRLDACRRHLEGLRDGLEEDHRKLSRLARGSTEQESALVDLEALAVRWEGRLRGIRDASSEFLRSLEGAVTDQLVDEKHEARYRKIAARLASCASAAGPSAAVTERAARARGAGSRDEYRQALQAAADAEQRYMQIFQKTVDGVNLWRESLELRREIRSICREQKGVNGELVRERDRDR
jgi:hypothetical protein